MGEILRAFGSRDVKLKEKKKEATTRREGEKHGGGGGERQRMRGVGKIECS